MKGCRLILHSYCITCFYVYQVSDKCQKRFHQARVKCNAKCNNNI